MEAIGNFLKGIGDLLMGLVDFVVGFIEDIVYMITITAKAVASIPGYFTWIPGEVLALIVVIFGVVVVYKVLGRE